MQERPAFIIHNMDHALAVARAAQSTGIAVALFSVRGGASSLGPEVFAGIMEAAKSRYPEARVEGILDCGVDAGPALSALRRGSKCISVDLPQPVLRKITDIAEKYGAQLREYPHNALDLAGRNQPDQDLVNHMTENTRK